MQQDRLQTCIEINYEKLLRNLPAKRLLHRLLIWYTCNTQPSLAARNGYTTATALRASALNNLLQAFCNPPAADVLMLTIKLYEPLHLNNVFLARAAIRDGICCPVTSRLIFLLVIELCLSSIQVQNTTPTFVQ